MEEANTCIINDEYLDISNSNLLDSIDFDDLFMDIDNGDELPDLEIDPDLLAEFSISGGEESSTTSPENVVSPGSFSDGNLCYVLEGLENGNPNNNNNNNIDNVIISEDLDVQTNYDNNDGLMRKNQLDDDVEIQSKRKGYEFEPVMLINSSPFDENNKVHKTSSHGLAKTRCNKSIDNHGKRKNKVEWTAELHKRFVQAVEQLGVDKAVPSRILELMGIHCLTRHNIASHLQKYRSHRKHSLAREIEAVNWTQKRQMYGVAMGGAKHGAVTMSWPPPTVGFTPMLTNMHHPLRPLHVWGHPTMDTQARRTVWPKQVVLPMARPPSTWTPVTPHHPHIDAFWHPSHHHRLPLPPVLPGIPPHVLYRSEHCVPPPQTTTFGHNTPTYVTETKESVDASIGDVLAKPWLPLPIGLKPPSMDTVLVELQRRGFPKIPPSCG